MNRIKKCLSLILALCIGTYGLPVFAMVTPTAVKTALSDEAMAQAVGGYFDAQLLTNMGGSGARQMEAVVSSGSNGGGCNGAYVFEIVNSDGVVLQTLTSGIVNQGQSIYLRGTVSAANNVTTNMARVKVTCITYPAFFAQDMSRHTASSNY